MMAMQFFYMEHDFYAGQFTKTAFPLFDGFDEKVALWFISWFNKSSKKYLGVLVRDFENEFYETELLVPYKSGKIAIDFIRERVRELEEERVRELEAYLKVAGLTDCSLTLAEREALNNLNSGGVIRKAFTIGQLFNIQKGKRLTKANMKDGNINFIGATSTNNGITAKIANNNYLHPANTITVNYNGSVGESFYQTEKFWASDDVNVLYPKFEMNESIALYFLAPLMKKGKGYGYAYKWTKEKMSEDMILLPTTSTGEPDYALMDTYISAVKKQIISRVHQFIKREKQTYLNVINHSAPQSYNTETNTTFSIAAETNN